MRAIARQLTQPRQEACGIAKLAQVAPGGKEHVLGDVAAHVEVPQDRQRDGRDDVARRRDQLSERLTITGGRGDDERLEILNLSSHVIAPKPVPEPETSPSFSKGT